MEQPIDETRGESDTSREMTPIAETWRLLGRIRLFLVVFVIGLVLSGLTAFPLEWEVSLLHRWMHLPALAPVFPMPLVVWIDRVYQGLLDTYRSYPFIAYGTDWLAFAHLVIAVAFIGPIKDPVRNIWVIEFGMIACLLVLPLAFIMGPLRGIPFFWRLIDCSFGVVGVVPLWCCWQYARRMEQLH